MKMSVFKIKEDHWMLILDFMENHREFATGRLIGINGREVNKKLWGDLASKLNSLGLGIRPVEKWQKSWTDYKSNLKKKAATLHSAQQRTGGGPPITEKLTQIEQRALNIMGRTIYQGCGTKELGLEAEDMEDVTAKQSAPVLKLSPWISEASASIISADTDTINTEDKTDRSSNFKRGFPENDNTDDHDYLAGTRSKKKKTTKCNEEIYEETVSVLKNIENKLEIGLANINNTIESKLTTLCDILLQK